MGNADSYSDKMNASGDDVRSRINIGWKWRGLVLIGAAFYAVALLFLAGFTVAYPYAPNPTHRYQAFALLDGHFYLSDSIYAVEFDHVFHDGKVQQVWGLGVGLWLGAFELVARPVGLSPIPERIPMAFAFFLFAYYCGITSLNLIRCGMSKVSALGLGYLPMLSPPLLTLAVLSPQNVYEESSIFGVLVSLAILLAVVRYAFLSSNIDLWICAGLAALSGLVRPTHAVYGLFGFSICFAIGYLRKTPKGILIGTCALYCFGIAFLLSSNHIRFGSVTEFGHNLTVTTKEGILTSRFVNPIRQAPIWDASKELAGALFFVTRNIYTMGDFDRGLFPGQTPYIRWRNWYVTTYDPSLLALLLVGVALLPILVRQCRHANVLNSFRAHSFYAPLLILAFGVLSSAAIFIFMLYYPGLCARYLYDAWPGFCAILIPLWLHTSTRFPIVSSLILLFWLGYEIARADCRHDMCRYLSRNEILPSLQANDGKRLRDFDGQFDANHHPIELPLKYGVLCWDKNTRTAAFTVMVPVDKPQFVELTVGPRMDGARPDTYRARIGNKELRLQNVERLANDEIRVLFEVPTQSRSKAMDEFLFLCFVSVGDDSDWASTRRLQKIRWK
jgi:hypothetical protein